MELRSVIIPPCVRGFTAPGSLFDVHIEGGHVRTINVSHAVSAAGEVAAQQPARRARASGTLIPAMADVHTHIDKTYVVEQVGAAEGDLFAAIHRMGEHRASWTAQDIATRMERALHEAYLSGTRALRTHLDWVGHLPPVALKVFEQKRDAWRGRVALQCVSLTPLDLFDDAFHGEDIALEVASVNASCNHAVGERALLGAFVYRNDRIYDKLQRVFDLAAKNFIDLDFHVDEGLHADACGLRAIAELTIKNSMQGRVTCGHACSLSVQPQEEAIATLKRCAQAGIHLVALPSTNLYLQGAWDATPVERGITKLKEAFSQGLVACIATDNVADGFFPYGSYDLLDTFALGVQAAHLAPPDAWLTSITTAPARTMGLPWDGLIAPGCPADLVWLPATTAHEIISPAGRALHSRRVMRNGQWI